MLGLVVRSQWFSMGFPSRVSLSSPDYGFLETGFLFIALAIVSS
ncbi:hypothetical protein T4D_7375 [Trichinella pseudospiralis]|uniref:Uncharacterized protein n=1 Tax=Trichinella pseudospiralis TaxID=6337 RepID=A0A0V1DNG6_TRIPS|nr:hypothetical protein T4D_7375 [Trichinella pseudospiralis]